MPDDPHASREHEAARAEDLRASAEERRELAEEQRESRSGIQDGAEAARAAAESEEIEATRLRIQSVIDSLPEGARPRKAESEELMPHAKAVALRIRGVDAVCGSKSRFCPRTARRRPCFRQSPAGKRWHFNDLKS